MSTPNLSLAVAPPVLTVQGIGKTYAGPVLADISLDLYAGEVLALTGENGAGKTIHRLGGVPKLQPAGVRKARLWALRARAKIRRLSV